ncbi:MAG: hypothetical protein C0518_00675 [Opitutus sp.]|nr:hypothetical protein [Opitutus sp.]
MKTFYLPRWAPAAPTARIAALRAIVAAGTAATTLLLASCTTPPKTEPAKPAEPVASPALLDVPPPAPREFRGVWVATVNNIDWPSKRGLTAAQQRAEIIAILDRAKAVNLNAVIFQVRPAADALYASELEPWSEYLSGAQGKSPGYDPLAVWVEEAHRRGLELHAWFNPYRARHAEAKSPLADTHVNLTNPEVVKRYGDLLWMDPGEAFAAERTLAVIRDVVKRYDIDGVHIDDYFYPYPIQKPLPTGAPKDAPREELDFPDNPSWQRYLSSGGKLSRADWRRDNVNRLVQRMHETVQAEKPWVKFGISPFGIARTDRRPPGITGFNQFEKLFADAELWFERGWCDYFTPQLYWPIDQKAQAFAPLLDYWVSQNKAGRHFWPGLFTSRIDDSPTSWSSAEVLAQVALTRTRPGATGHIHFSAVALMQDRKAIATNLAALYATPALVPASPWMKVAAPAAPELTREGDVVKIAGLDANAVRLAVWRRANGAWRFSIHPAMQTTQPFGVAEALVVSAVNRAGVESARVVSAP